MDKDALILRLFEAQAVKFGNFTLKSGVKSPVYFDLRVTISYPSLLVHVSEKLWAALQEAGINPACICGVPYTALPFATQMSVAHQIPMVIKRKEAKSYGTKSEVEGDVRQGAQCVIVEDVVTSGGSVLETALALRAVGLHVDTAIVLLNREQGGKENLYRHGISLISVLSVHEVLASLQQQKCISTDTVHLVTDFLSECRPQLPPTERQSLASRAASSSNTLSCHLLSLMRKKKTNLAFSADVTDSDTLLKVTEQVAPHICLLKTHVDALPDFTAEVALSLAALSQQHGFLIMEDRKFADIGSTCQKQFRNQHYHLQLGWAHLVTVHALPGPGVLKALREVAPAGMGCVLVAEMSSEGNLTSDSYAQGAVKMAEANSDFVVGLVCQRRLSSIPSLLHMTPGVHLSSSGDNLGQQYRTPEEVIKRRLCDIVIVGRAIHQASEPGEVASKYKEAAYNAYTPRD